MKTTHDPDATPRAKTWFMVSSGPTRQPTGHAIHPDEARVITSRDTVRIVTWPQGWQNASVYVEAATYEDAIATSARLFAAAWREGGDE